MPLSTEKIPNNPLSGREVLEVACARFREMLERDCYFGPGLAYGRVGMTITAVFDLGQAIGRHEVQSYTKPDGAIEGEAPLANGDDAQLVALEVEYKPENANLERVAHGLPIVTQVRNPQEPGQAFPSFRNEEISYDKRDYPEPAPAVFKDVTEEKTRAMGLKRVKGGAPERLPWHGSAPKG